MSEMTVLQLLQCFAWAFFGLLPLSLSYAGGAALEAGEEGNMSAFWPLGAVFFQTVLVIAAYKAGSLLK